MERENYMVKITKDDVLKVARLSHISIHDDELEKVVDQLQSVLSYAAQISDCTDGLLNKQDNKSHGCNILRPDVAVTTNSEPILEAAPEREGSYFVVPAIIEAGK
jgi:aspartyl-tRNA(Asn)/glutamyl-tRNA(Gln) amidotransferase subunit C